MGVVAPGEKKISKQVHEP